MKNKIIATFLCLLISSPCFAATRGPGPQHHPPMQPPLRIERNCCHNEYPHGYYSNVSQRTKNLAVLTGITGLAAIVSSIMD